MNEQRILRQIGVYWESDLITCNMDEFNRFVEETKDFILNKKVEKQIETLEKVMLRLHNNDYKDIEDLLDEMRDQKLLSTLVYKK